VAKVIFVRHGESVWNEARRFQGNSDPELSARGHAQAARVAQRLRGAGLVAALYTSPLRRAAVTAQAIGEALGLPPRPEHDLREMGLGAWEGLTPTEIGERWGDAYHRWVRDPAGHVPAGGEGMEVFSLRVAAAVDRMRAAHAGQDVVVVSHGGAIGAYLCRVLGLGISSLFRFKLENASLTEVLEDHVGLRLALLNDTSHLRDGAAPRPSIVT